MGCISYSKSVILTILTRTLITFTQNFLKLIFTMEVNGANGAPLLDSTRWNSKTVRLSILSSYIWWSTLNTKVILFYWNRGSYVQFSKPSIISVLYYPRREPGARIRKEQTQRGTSEEEVGIWTCVKACLYILLAHLYCRHPFALIDWIERIFIKQIIFASDDLQQYPLPGCAESRLPGQAEEDCLLKVFSF